MGAIVMANGDACKLAAEVGVPHKALLEFAGASMIERVVAALQGCPQIGQIVVSCRPGGPIADHLGDRAELGLPEDPTFLGGIAQGFAQMPQAERALLVTCDMPLLTPQAVGHFVEEAAYHPEADVVYGMVDISLTRRRYPGTRRTAIRLKEGSYTASGLTVVSRRFVEHCGPLLMAAFQARKSKLAMARLLGYGFLVKFALGMLSVHEVLARAEVLLDGKVAAVAIPYAECGFDVDSQQDLAAVRDILARPKS
jgi:GTP:adenosylcobinamide-phosphate guanylyltransferase